jgi:glutamyl-Q tRNA(Asp) synthetase
VTEFLTRFAPSPTGRLHLGHAYSALRACDAAREAGGRFVLRIEDSDRGRCRAEYDAAILEDLAWLGIEWEEPVRRQSEHTADYARALESLIERRLVYRCFRTRRELMDELPHAPHGPQPTFRGGPLHADDEARRIAEGEPFAWRLSLDRAREELGERWHGLTFDADASHVSADPERLGDAILARKEFPASYHLASVHDDALQGVTHVIRGEDLRDVVHLHVLLQALLDLPTPIYQHHPLIVGADGRRLAKRDRSETLAELRGAGVTPQEVRRRLGLRD